MKPSLLLSLFFFSSCTTLNGHLPGDAPTTLRAAYAGKTLECAGRAGQEAVYASIAAASATTGASVLAAQAANSQGGTALLYSLGSFGLAVGSLGLSIYGLLKTYDAAKLHEAAGRVLAGQSREACIEGEIPRQPEEAPPPPPPPPT